MTLLFTTYNVTSLLTLVTSSSLSRLITISRNMSGVTTVITLGALTSSTAIVIHVRLHLFNLSLYLLAAKVTRLTTAVARGSRRTTITTTAAVATAVAFRAIARHMTDLITAVTGRSISVRGLGTVARLQKC